MPPSSSEVSGFRFYSFGIVTEDKTDDGDYIKVTPIEELPLVKGKLSEATFDYSSKGTDHIGATVNTKVKGIAYVIAKWTGLESGNRNTAPNVYEGETVVLLKFASTDDVFWCDLFREPRLRRLENVIHCFSNQSKKGEPYDLDSSYFMQVSTRDKLIHLHTSNNDGEPVTYDFILNTGRGTFQVIDSNKNEMFLDSVKGDLTFNIQNSIEMNAPMIRINGEKYVRTTAPEITETGDDITNKASKTIKQESGTTFSIQSGAMYSLTANGYSMSSSGASTSVSTGSMLIQASELDFCP